MEEIRNRLDQAAKVLPSNRLAEYQQNLSKILTPDAQKPEGNKAIHEHLAKAFETAASHQVTNLLRHAGLSEPLSYQSLLTTIAKALGYSARPTSTVATLEDEIVGRYMEILWDKANPSQKHDLKKILLEALSQSETPTAKQLKDLLQKTKEPLNALFKNNKFTSNLSLYISATTAMEITTSALGSILSLTRAKSLALALTPFVKPLGLLAAGALATYHLGQPDYEKKVLPAIMVLAALRAETGFFT